MRAALWLAALVPALAAQTVTVSGTVSNAITHEPIAGVAVHLWGHSGMPSAETDASGAFHMTKVVPGTYRSMLSVKGFSAERTTVVVDANPPPLHFAMTPWPAVRGRVLDPERNPLAHVPVRAVRNGVATGFAAETDELGRYTLARIEPGEYRIEALPPASDGGQETELAPTSVPDAAPVTLAPGDDLGGYDIVLRRVPVFRVSGKVLDDRGEPAAGVTVEAENAAKKATTRADGTFELARVRPGDGRIEAKLVRDGVELRGFATVLVTNRDVDDTTLRLAAPVDVQGTMEVDGKRASEPGYASLTSADGHGIFRAAQWKGPAFHFTGIYPGRYRMKVTAPSRMFANDVYLDSVQVGGRDITVEEFEIAPGMLPFQVVLKTGGGLVRGSVENGDGGFVVLVPKEERLRVTGFIVTTVFNGAQFTVDNVRPGEYYAFAFQEGSFNVSDMQDARYAARVLAGAPSLKVDQGGTSTLTLLYVKLPSSQ